MIRWFRQRNQSEHRAAAAIQQRFPDVMFHLRDAFDVNRVDPGTELAYARINRHRDVLSLCTAVHRLDRTTSEWQLAVARADRVSGAPLTLPGREAWQWAIAVFGPAHAESVVTATAPPPEELPIQYRAAAHFTLRVGSHSAAAHRSRPRNPGELEELG